jgi:hypothetical protein
MFAHLPWLLGRGHAREQQHPGVDGGSSEAASEFRHSSEFVHMDMRAYAVRKWNAMYVDDRLHLRRSAAHNHRSGDGISAYRRF